MDLNNTMYRLRCIAEENQAPIILYISSNREDSDSSVLYQKLKEEVKFPIGFYELVVSDWDTYLTPWAVEGCFKNRMFSGDASQLLHEIEQDVILRMKEQCPAHQGIYLLGYSLAGLFSLWALYECNQFAGAACCSGSLWYPGWMEYVESHSIHKKACVYLSLGRKEVKNRHSVMRQIGNCMQSQLDLLKGNPQITETILEWNEGGHFDYVLERLVKGAGWMMASKEAETYTVRRFGNTDAQEVSEMVCETLRTVNQKDYTEEYIERTVKSFQSEHIIERASWTHFYVVLHQNQIVGCGAIGPYWGSMTESSLFTIFVHAAYQGKGIGRKIIETLEQDEFFLRAKRIEIPASITALPFYQRMGYTLKGNIDAPDHEGLLRLEKFR